MKNPIKEKVRALVNLLNNSDKILPVFVKIKGKTTGELVETVALMVRGGKYDTTNNKLILFIYQNHSTDRTDIQPVEQSFDLEEIFDLDTPTKFLKENWD